MTRTLILVLDKCTLILFQVTLYVSGISKLKQVIFGTSSAGISSGVRLDQMKCSHQKSKGLFFRKSWQLVNVGLN